MCRNDEWLKWAHFWNKLSFCFVLLSFFFWSTRNPPPFAEDQRMRKFFFVYFIGFKMIFDSVHKCTGCSIPTEFKCFAFNFIWISVIMILNKRFSIKCMHVSNVGRAAVGNWKILILVHQFENLLFCSSTSASSISKFDCFSFFSVFFSSPSISFSLWRNNLHFILIFVSAFVNRNRPIWILHISTNDSKRQRLLYPINVARANRKMNSEKKKKKMSTNKTQWNE